MGGKENNKVKVKTKRIIARMMNKALRKTTIYLNFIINTVYIMTLPFFFVAELFFSFPLKVSGFLVFFCSGRKSPRKSFKLLKSEENISVRG